MRLEAVWVSDPAAATVWRIDPRHNRVTDDRWEAYGDALAVTADGVVWATSMAGCGSERRRGCSTSAGASCGER